MTWFKVDDNLAFHRKTVAAGNAAMGLWVRSGSWCAAHLTDGFIPDHMIAILGSAAQMQKLVKAGLWITVEGGCQFHGWNEKGRQPTSKSVMEDREKGAARQSRHRAGTYSPAPSAQEKNNLATTSSIKYGRTASGLVAVDNALFSEEPQVDHTCNGVSNPLVTGVVTGVVTTAPSRPVPKRQEQEQEQELSLAPLADRDWFAEFYEAYPRRQDRRRAEGAWKAAIKRGADPAAVLAATVAYARQQVGNERRFIKLPATWLNAAAYDNEPETLARSPHQPADRINGWQQLKTGTDGRHMFALPGGDPS